MKSLNLKKICSFLLVFALAASLFCVFPQKAAAEENGEDRLITITAHAGDYGYFGDPSVQDKELLCFNGDYLIFDEEPTPVTPSRIFSGWATVPDAQEPDVFSRQSIAGEFGTDIYAVWSTTGTVLYNCHEGYLEMEGSQYEYVLMTYEAGTPFRVLIPVHPDDRFVFEGWYMDYYAGGTHYTEDYLIDSPAIEVIAQWSINDSKVDELELDKEYHFAMFGPGDYYSFIPQETGAYKLYTYSAQLGNAYIRLLDTDLKQKAVSPDADLDGNAVLRAELEAGTKYYFQIREAGGNAAMFDFTLTREESIPVTFHANSDQAFIYFDQDPSCKEKTILIGKGTDIRDYKTGLTVNDAKLTRFLGWADRDDAPFPSSFLIVNEPMDVYAVYKVDTAITLDANGGYYSVYNKATEIPYVYEEGDIFKPEHDPRVDDPRFAFWGWATTPDAEVPDVDTGNVLSEDLPDTLYAVYSEKIIVTYDANGGYFFFDTNQHIHTYITGKGHHFAGTAVKNENEHLVPGGWLDQNGVYVPYIINNYYGYKYEGDTYLTAVWDRRVYLDANGGFFSDLEFEDIMVDYKMDSPFECPDDADLWHPDSRKRLVGWSTSPDGEILDVIEGETPVNDLETVYAIWEDVLYVIEEGDGAQWDESKGGDLRFTVKRVEDDELTFPNFTGIEIDGREIPSAMFSAEEGSLILTVREICLRTLSAGDHELTVKFTDGSVQGTFSVVKEETPDARPNPKTGTGIFSASILIPVLASVCGMFRRKRR